MKWRKRGEVVCSYLLNKFTPALYYDSQERKKKKNNNKDV